MKNCQRCNSQRVATVSGKCSDLAFARMGKKEHQGYVPLDMGITDDEDYICINYCLECGQLQGKFPVPTCHLEVKG
jgi:hypothetical protein